MRHAIVNSEMSAWSVDETRLVATLSVGKSGVYEVDLLRARTRDEALDWVHHLADQPWATAEHVRGLVDILLHWNVKRVARAVYDHQEPREQSRPFRRLKRLKPTRAD